MKILNIKRDISHREVIKVKTNKHKKKITNLTGL